MSSEFLGEVVGLIDQQKELLLAFVLIHFLNVLFKITRVIEVRIPGIHDLQ